MASSNSESSRTLVVVGGPNGSGKTTLAKGYLKTWPARYLSAERSQKNFWSLYRSVADSWHLYFNGGDDLRPVAVGDRESYQVLDEDLLGIFAFWAMERPQSG